MLRASISKYERALELIHHWRFGGSPTNYSSLLFSLIEKANLREREKIASIYPEEVIIFILWQKAKDETEFFKDVSNEYKNI